MNEAVFSQIALLVLLTGLIVWMGFIVWDLAKKSKAGKFGTLALFVVAGCRRGWFSGENRDGGNHESLTAVSVVTLRPLIGGRIIPSPFSSSVFESLARLFRCKQIKDPARCGFVTPAFSDLPNPLISQQKSWKKNSRPMPSNPAAPRKPADRAGYLHSANTVSS